MKWLENSENSVLNVDLKTYAHSAKADQVLSGLQNYHYCKLDIAEHDLFCDLLFEQKPSAIINFAAETHVDNSITSPGIFIHTNVTGTFSLLSSATRYWESLNGEERQFFRVLHVSTDEVFGSLSLKEEAFTEQSPYLPNSPYAASKAASDHLCRAWNKTYQLPVIVTNCSNNFGPFQNKEKLIPKIISNALSGKNIPIYGTGENIRDWIFVEEHVDALLKVLSKGRVGTSYNIGGNMEISNLVLVERICAELDHLYPKEDGKSYNELISYVEDRKGHDFRYAICNKKICSELGWMASSRFEDQLRTTIKWYLENN